MASFWIWATLALVLCLSTCAWSAAIVGDVDKFGELERTLKELATSVLAMSGGSRGADATEGSMDMLGSDAAAALIDLTQFDA